MPQQAGRTGHPALRERRRRLAGHRGVAERVTEPGPRQAADPGLHRLPADAERLGEQARRASRPRSARPASRTAARCARTSGARAAARRPARAVGARGVWGGGQGPMIAGGVWGGIVPPGQHVLAQPIGHDLGHRPAVAGQPRPQPLPLLLVQPERQQPPRPLRLHLATARARPAAGTESTAGVVRSASTRSRYRRVSAARRRRFQPSSRPMIAATWAALRNTPVPPTP